MRLTYRACMACGFEGNEREVRLVVVEVPPDERVDVSVAIPVTFREGAVEEVRQVPGRYAAELRCIEVGACRLRAAALTDEQRGVRPVPARDDLAAWKPVDEAVGGSKLPATPGPQDRPAAIFPVGQVQTTPPRPVEPDDELAAWTP